MGGPRIAVDAAMFTAPIGVYGLIEGYVRTLVCGDDRARGFFMDGCLQGFEIVQPIPAVIDGISLPGFITA